MHGREGRQDLRWREGTWVVGKRVLRSISDISYQATGNSTPHFYLKTVRKKTSLLAVSP